MQWLVTTLGAMRALMADVAMHAPVDADARRINSMRPFDEWRRMHSL